MTYGYRDRASAASAAAVQRALVRASGTWGGYRACRPSRTQVRAVAEQAPKSAPQPAPGPVPRPANDLTPADPDCEQIELKKGSIGNG
jgi:hypothetical protein